MPHRNPTLTKIAVGYRNVHKRQYAEDYADYLDGFRATEPERPADLSYMGAQAVRLTMHDALKPLPTASERIRDAREAR